MKVLVTGASGLIGRWICDLLYRDGSDVLGVDLLPKPSDTLLWDHRVCNLLDKSALRKVLDDFGPSHIVHLAARTDLLGSAVDNYPMNTEGVEILCEEISRTSSVERVVFTSSMLVCEVGDIPADDRSYSATTPYGLSKVQTEAIVRRLDGGGVSWCLARPTTVWGPHMSEHYQRLLKHISRGTYFHPGGGALLKSYAYVGNIAYQFSKLLTAPPSLIARKTFYLADYDPISLRSYVNGLAEHINARTPVTLPLALARVLAVAGDLMEVCGMSPPLNSFRLNNIRTEYVFDLSQTKAVCGDLPYSFDEGVEMTASWYKTLTSALN